MSLINIRNKNKRQNSFVYSKIDPGNLSINDVKKIKDEVFYKIVNPTSCNMLTKFIKD